GLASRPGPAPAPGPSSSPDPPKPRRPTPARPPSPWSASRSPLRSNPAGDAHPVPRPTPMYIPDVYPCPEKSGPIPDIGVHPPNRAGPLRPLDAIVPGDPIDLPSPGPSLLPCPDDSPVDQC